MRRRHDLFRNAKISSGKTGRSQRGASLPLVLLLFLICAVAASVVIAAGSAAAGRASQLSNSDKLYYSVTSAANVLRENLFYDEENGQGHSVTAVITDNKATGTQSFDLLFDGSPSDDSNYNLLERAALYALFGDEEGKTSYSLSDLPTSDFYSGDLGSYKMTHDSATVSSDVLDNLKVNVAPHLDESGRLTLSLSQEIGSSKFSLDVVCDADTDSNTIYEVNPETGEIAYEVRYQTITWAPSKVEKG